MRRYSKYMVSLPRPPLAPAEVDSTDPRPARRYYCVECQSLTVQHYRPINGRQGTPYGRWECLQCKRAVL